MSMCGMKMTEGKKEREVNGDRNSWHDDDGRREGEI